MAVRPGFDPSRRHHRPGLREASSVRSLDPGVDPRSWGSRARSQALRGAPSGDGVEAAWIVLEDPALARLAQVRALRDDLHRVRELAVPVVVVRGVDDHVLAEGLHHPRHAALVGIAADEAAAGEEVLARLAVDPRRLLGRQLPVLVEALEPEGEPADAGLQESDAQLRKAVQDAAQREGHDRDHLPDGVREGVHLEPGAPPVDADRHLVDRLPAAVDADRDAEAFSLGPDHIEAPIIEVLLADVLRGHHADHAELGDGAAEFGGRRLGVDQGELGDRLEARGRVAAELGARVVERPAERDREAALEPRPLLARAAGEHDGHVDALEVHVFEAAAWIGHAGPREAVDARRAARLLDADARQVRELLVPALAPGRHFRLELARQAFLPVGGLAAVAVGVDHEGAELTHGRYLRRRRRRARAARRADRRARRRTRRARSGA